ncbi:hypothetical protein KUTeg_019945, partial [Tegillarca granosa]
MDFHKITTLIGRNRSQVDYVLDSSTYMRSAYISRNHARVVRQVRNSDAHRLFDDSLNGIFVNNLKIAGSVVLSEGDLVTFGHPNGSQVAAGVRCRQPNSEYQFLFERCDCRVSDNSALHPSDQGFAVPSRPSPTGKWIKKRDRNTTQSFTTEDVRKLRDGYQTAIKKENTNDKADASKQTNTPTRKDESLDNELDYQNIDVLYKLPEKEKEKYSNKNKQETTKTNERNSGIENEESIVDVDNGQEISPSAVSMETSMDPICNSSDNQCDTSLTENNIEFDDEKIDTSLQIDHSIDCVTDEKEPVNTSNIRFSNSIDYPPEYYYDDSDEEILDQEENTEINNTKRNKNNGIGQENSVINKVRHLEVNESDEESVKSNPTKGNKMENVEEISGDVEEISNEEMNYPFVTEISEQNIAAEASGASSLSSIPISPETSDEQVDLIEVIETSGQIEVTKFDDCKNMLEVLEAGEQMGVTGLAETSDQNNVPDTNVEMPA